MDNQSPEQRESLWRRQLSEAEQAALRGQPELELEARLTDALKQLSDLPVPSNFTARVLEAIDLEESQLARATESKRQRWNWHSLLPRFAVVTAAVLFAGLGLQHHEAVSQRAAMAQSLSVVASDKAMPSVEALENLDAIQRMSQSAHADTELLAALQQ